MCGVYLNERPTKPYVTPKKARTTAAFTNANKVIVRKGCRRFQSRLETVVEANGDFSD